ncbi:DUF3103 family protein [Microbulbifer sp. 2205BS26-8]|uniref:DUF3103 family protein n=1 Tax=Microbulbifer sp. 2205BS26-8 TaxID=3064386 RepID=UPI00273F5DC3|nr:DUF3103 family protein [Microbulbifer sp. 2205BS26-8]MDP5210310.1 DUF3103 family protein [Microbulbifer sp. 2205BS26-8]
MKFSTLSVLFCIAFISITASANIIPYSDSRLATQHAPAKAIAENKRILAKNFANSYASSLVALRQHINQYDLSASVGDIYHSNKSKKLLSKSNHLIRTAKGLNANGENLIQLRMASKEMVTAWQNGEAPLFAFAPAGDEKQWTSIEAYDTDGNIHFLDVHILPQQPVFIVEVNGRKALKEGIEIMRGIFSGGIAETPPQNTSRENAAQSLSTSVLKHIRLNDDEEPWILGKAEIYAITNGISPSRDEPVLDVVDMPYLDHDDTDYYPNQVLFHWSRYRWQAADLMLMEHDENTNFQEIASNLLNLAVQILQSIPFPDVQGYAIIAIITNGILNALPAEWFINNDDYVDSIYTTFENQEYINLSGARGNATITLKPLEIDSR